MQLTVMDLELILFAHTNISVSLNRQENLTIRTYRDHIPIVRVQ